jgi:proline racemase
MGYKLGPMLGGRGQISAKPSVGIGPDAPFGWGVQVAFQLLGL